MTIGERNRTIGLLVAAQLGCLLSGVWLQHRFAMFSIGQDARTAGWTSLAETSSPTLADLVEMPVASLRAGNVAGAQIQGLWSPQDQPSEAVVTVVDARWRVVVSQSHAPGTQLSWSASPAAENAARTASPVGGQRAAWGVVRTPSGEDLAVAYPTSRRDGYVLVHRPASSLAAAVDTVSTSLWQAGALTVLWTMGLLSVVAYLVIAPPFERSIRCRAQSDAAVLRQAEAMSRMRDAVIFGLVKLTESRDSDTGYHLERIALFSSRLALALRRRPEFRQEITPEFVRLIEISSILHDIGKVGVEDSVLLKPGRLTPLERRRMQRHANIGGQCLLDIEQRLGSSNFLQMAREIAFYHHERWDGLGYPRGLKGEQIPLAARIVAVCDVYEALASKRIYKDPLPHDQCVEYIRQQAGKHFDPRIAETFVQVAAQFQQIARQYANPIPAEGSAAEADAKKSDQPPLTFSEFASGLPLEAGSR
jgi:HD-GYP domain-containing protein (c-di-GMP phosphodiesterase class II)